MKLPKKRVLSNMLFMGGAFLSLSYTWGTEVPVDQVLGQTPQLKSESKSLSKEDMMDELLVMTKDVFILPIKESTFLILDQSLPSDEAEEIRKACDYAFLSFENPFLKIMKKIYMHNLSHERMKALYEYYNNPEIVTFTLRWASTAVRVNDHLRFGIRHYNEEAETLPDNMLSQALKEVRPKLPNCFEALRPFVEQYARKQDIPWTGEISDKAWKAILKSDYSSKRTSKRHPFNFQDKQIHNICEHVIVKMYKDTVGDYPEGVLLYDNFMKKQGEMVKELDSKVNEQIQLKLMPLLSEKMDEYFEQKKGVS